MKTISERVAWGAAWLDDKYPGWVDRIDLAALEMSDCNACILGQVYTGLVPEAERNQLLAQAISDVTSGYPDSEQWAAEYLQEVREGKMGGYQVLTDVHQLIADGTVHGFAAVSDGEDGEDTEYQLLLDEWTRVILSRRLAAQY
jgi:hypothetical protein